MVGTKVSQFGFGTFFNNVSTPDKNYYSVLRFIYNFCTNIFFFLQII